jgi:hypothetical protein
MKAQVFYTDAERNAIIKDLLKKTPKARVGDERAGLECFSDYVYCDRYNKYRDLWKCNKAFWGYSLEQIVKCRIASRSAIEEAVRDEAAAAGKSISYQAVNRRANRIEDRISKPLRTAIRSGDLRGIYTVNRGWETIGAVAAENEHHAKQLAQVTYGVLVKEGERALKVEWAGPVSRELLLTTIQGTRRQDFDTRIAEIRKRAESQIAQLERQREESSYVTLLGLDLVECIEEPG